MDPYLTIGSLQIRVKTLEGETVPGLCRQLDELRAQRQFLFKSFRNACEQYGATQGMKDYAGDVADGALKILGVNLDQLPEDPKAKQYRDALKEAVEALRGVALISSSTPQEIVNSRWERVGSAIAKAEGLLK